MSDDPLDALRDAPTGAPAPVKIRPGSDEAKFLEEVAYATATLGELPSSADEWAESATETLVGIAQTVEATGRVSEGQDRALRNIRTAAERWIR